MKRDDECSSKGFVIGALVGAALGVGAALLLAPKAGCDLRDDIKDLYDNACDKTSEIASNLKDKTNDLIQKADIHEENGISQYFEDHNSTLLIVAIGGAVLGIAAALYAKSDSNDDLHEKYENVKEWVSSAKAKGQKEWPKKAKRVVDNLTETFEELKESGEKSYYKTIDDLLHWVSLGLTVVDKLHKK